MKLINADMVVHWQTYDDEHETFPEHEGTITEFLDAMTDEGCPDSVDILPSAQPDTARRIVGKSRDGMTLWYQCDMCNEPVDVQDNYCRVCGRRLIDE